MISITPTPYNKEVNTAYKDTAILKLEKSHFNGVNVIPGRIVLVFESCLFNKLIIENDEALDFEDVSIMFSYSFIRELEVSSITDNNVSIHLFSCILSGHLFAPNLGSVHINNCLLNDGLFLLNISNITINYTTENIFPSHWKRLFQLTCSDFKYFTQNNQYYHIENPGKLIITSTKKSDDPAGYFLMEYNTKPFRIGYRLPDALENLLKIHVYIKYGREEDSLTRIENVRLKSLSLTGNPAGKVAIESLKISNWYLSEFSPGTQAGFYDVTPRLPAEEETKIGIHQCNLDKVWFDNVYFEDFDRLSFYRSKFSSAIFTSCSFPDSYEKFAKFMPIANIHYPENKTQNYDKDQYEIFLQLKKAMEATGNNYESLKMQAVSHAALRKINSITSGDRFILYTSDLFNKHGQSIGRPLWWFLGVSSFGYLFYLWTLKRLFQSTDFDPNLIGYYFSFIDLTHRADFLVSKEEINGWALAIDYLTKVFLGYLIFQFVAAFRKYGKK